MTNKEIKTPSLLDAMLPILALVIMMGSAVYLFADNSSYGPNQIALLLAMGLAVFRCLLNSVGGRFSYWHMDASWNRAYAYLFRFRVA